MDALAGRDLLERALAAEPSYPLAHAALATAWATLGYDANARAQAKQALEAAEKLSREDHLLVEARYYETVKNWQKAIEAYQVLVSYLPDSPEYALALANAQSSGGKGKDALATLAALGRTGAAAKDDPRIDLGVSQAASSLGDSKLRRDAAEQSGGESGPPGSAGCWWRARGTRNAAPWRISVRTNGPSRSAKKHGGFSPKPEIGPGWRARCTRWRRFR